MSEDNLDIGHDMDVRSGPSLVTGASDRHEAVRKPYILGQNNSRPRSSLPTRPQELGGLHRSPPTGNRHLSKQCDKLLQQFAEEWHDDRIGLSVIQNYFASLRQCSRCKSMKPPEGGHYLSSPRYSSVWYCEDCWAKTVLGGPPEPDDGLKQNRLF